MLLVDCTFRYADLGDGRRCCFFFQAEDGIRDLVRSRGLGDVYKRQLAALASSNASPASNASLAPTDAVIPTDVLFTVRLSLIHI